MVRGTLMNCRACDYPLDWLISARCPECGQSFDPTNPATFIDGSRREAIRRIWRRWGKRLLILMLVLLPIEVGCAFLAFHTLSAIDSGMVFILAILGNLFALFIFLVRLPRIALALTILIAVLIIPNQARLGIRLLMLNYEVARIIDFAEEELAESGEYPFNLADYKFVFASNEKHVERYLLSAGQGYMLYWHIGNSHASHWYSPGGGYGYYPD